MIHAPGWSVEGAADAAYELGGQLRGGEFDVVTVAGRPKPGIRVQRLAAAKQASMGSVGAAVSAPDAAA